MISASAAERSVWTAGALLYAGRPDPSWAVRENAPAFVHYFMQLAPFAGGKPDQSRLGYRGTWLRAPDGHRWVAYAGVVWYEGTDEIRADEARTFERALLATAAPGSLPEELYEYP